MPCCVQFCPKKTVLQSIDPRILKLLNNSLSLNKRSHYRDSVSISDLNINIECYDIILIRYLLSFRFDSFKTCLGTFPNASRFIQNTPLRAVFFNSQSVSLVVCTCGEAHSVSCLICFIFSHPKMLTILQCYLLSIFLQTQTVVVEVSLMKTCLCVRASLIAADKSSGIILLAN